MYDSERSHAIFLSRYRLLHYFFRKNYSFLLLLSWAAYLHERRISKRNEQIILWSILRNCLPFSFLKNIRTILRLFRISQRYCTQTFSKLQIARLSYLMKSYKITRYPTIQRYTNIQIYCNFQGLEGLRRSRKIGRFCQKCCVRFDRQSLNRSKTLWDRCIPRWSFSIILKI